MQRRVLVTGGAGFPVMLTNASILITGETGSFGQAFVRQGPEVDRRATALSDQAARCTRVHGSWYERHHVIPYGRQTVAPDAQVLEIGCGDGSRVQHLANEPGNRAFGVDSSQKAVARATSTAEALPFADALFEAAALFGFWLYLCDDEDLSRIALEAERPLTNPGWLLILDFEAQAPAYRPYHRAAGVTSRKMGYKSMFLWHPSYTPASHEKFHGATLQWADESEEWMSLVCLRKHLPTQ